jgi:hypothetical protein
MYKEIIRRATGCPSCDVDRIEDFMRGVIWKSTLDWQTAEELTEAARLAYCVLRYKETGRLLPPYPNLKALTALSF